MGRGAGVGGLEGAVADSQVGKQASLQLLKNNLVLLYCLMLTLSKSAGSLLQQTNHCHHPSLTGDENGEVLSKSERYHSSRRKGQGYERRWLQSHSLCREKTDTLSL